MEPLEGTTALEHFIMESKKKKTRLSPGDFLHDDEQVYLSPGEVHCGFRSILQGDHAGVKSACAAHSQLLRNAGLLVDEETLSGKRPLVVARFCAQGLCIDDDFCVSVQPKASSTTTYSSQCCAKAQRCYIQNELNDASKVKTIGAEISGDPQPTHH